MDLHRNAEVLVAALFPRGLAEDLEHRMAELRDLIQKQHS